MARTQKKRCTTKKCKKQRRRSRRSSRKSIIRYRPLYIPGNVSKFTPVYSTPVYSSPKVVYKTPRPVLNVYVSKGGGGGGSRGGGSGPGGGGGGSRGGGGGSSGGGGSRGGGGGQGALFPNAPYDFSSMNPGTQYLAQSMVEDEMGRYYSPGRTRGGQHGGNGPGGGSSGGGSTSARSGPAGGGESGFMWQRGDPQERRAPTGPKMVDDKGRLYRPERRVDVEEQGATVRSTHEIPDAEEEGSDERRRR